MDIYEAIQKHKRLGHTMMTVTVVDKEDAGPLEVGKKMLITSDGSAYGTVGGGAIEYEARNLCGKLIQERQNLMKTYVLMEGRIVEDAETLPMACGGKATLFYEYIGPKAYVIIFGAGHVGQALCHVLKTMDFYVRVIDDREAVIEAFVGADQKYHQSFVSYIDDYGIETGDYVIVCTPSHQYDYQVLHKVIEMGLKPKYIGMLCSSVKLKDYLKRTYEVFGHDVDLSHFYSPIGLDIGGGSPAEIAISIAAEILSIQYEKTGHRHMRGDY